MPTLVDDETGGDAGRDNLSDDMSDTGWDTDLEIEGVCDPRSTLILLLLCYCDGMVSRGER